MSSPTIAKEAPPYVTFDFKEHGQDEKASALAGRPIPRVIAFATIMQHGDKFAATEKIADEWLQQIEERARNGMYNPEWVTRFKMAYEHFLKGEELPREGTPVKTWPAANREQVIRLIALGITTVEDLAAIPDQGLGQVGLDGRYLRDLAKNYIASGKDLGSMAKRLSDLEQKDREKDEIIQRLEAQNAALAANQPQREVLHTAKK